MPTTLALVAVACKLVKLRVVSLGSPMRASPKLTLPSDKPMASPESKPVVAS